MQKVKKNLSIYLSIRIKDRIYTDFIQLIIIPGLLQKKKGGIKGGWGGGVPHGRGGLGGL